LVIMKASIQMKCFAKHGAFQKMSGTISRRELARLEEVIMIESWIVPCNIKHFDLISHFENTDTVVWKNSFSIKNGDVVYIYVGAPISEIRYRCTVISDSVSDELLDENKYAIVKKTGNNYFSKKIKYVQLKKEVEYPDNLLPLEQLRKNGLGQVQIQARVDRKLKLFIDSQEGATANG